MPLSKSARIKIFLAVDSVFFLLELTVGYAVHSLALVADSFHMLNDVLSLCVGLWAVKVANTRAQSKMYTYGWQRAETLGALVNGVFLIALCLSIFLEAIQRFVEPQEVKNPKLVLIVGSLGLLSNIVGLFLFHDHGHSHGGHSHGPEETLSDAEEGHAHAHEGETHDHVTADSRSSKTATIASGKNRSESYLPKRSASGKRIVRKHRSRSRTYQTIDEIHVHPASFRDGIIAASRIEPGSETETDTDNIAVEEEENGVATETSPLLSKSHSHVRPVPKDNHADHIHSKPKEEGGKKGHHSHGDLNMRGVFLHVLGDALGNIGVIATALIIWLTDYWWRFYSDPAISLIITVIILGSAIPLCKAASRILLQAVPVGLSIDDIKDDIATLDGVISCHHLHVWQLSDTKLIASLHVQVGFDLVNEASAKYMQLAREIRKCLHEYGIHSSTIQPEFCLDTNHDHSAGGTDNESGGEDHGGSAKLSRASSVHNPEACLLACGDDCQNSKQCCISDVGCGSAAR